MTDANINLIVKHLAKEELREDEIELLKEMEEKYTDEVHKIEAIYKANIFKTMAFNREEAYEKVKAVLDLDIKQTKTVYFYQRTWLKIAASILILISVSILALSQYEWKVVLNNSTATVQKHSLPDGSEIILDKLANVSYNRTVFKSFNRKLALQGRAYFHISKDPTKQFVVNTSQVDITVLGTQFTVNQQNGKTQIVLNEGVIRLEGNSIVEGKVLSIPGAQVLVNNNLLLKDNIVPQELYASWINNTVRFNSCTVSQVFDFLQDSYGISLSLSDQSKLENSLYGSAPSDDPYIIIKALEEILNVKIEIITKN